LKGTDTSIDLFVELAGFEPGDGHAQPDRLLLRVLADQLPGAELV